MYWDAKVRSRYGYVMLAYSTVSVSIVELVLIACLVCSVKSTLSNQTNCGPKLGTQDFGNSGHDTKDGCMLPTTVGSLINAT